jgi:hypothetical protein
MKKSGGEWGFAAIIILLVETGLVSLLFGVWGAEAPMYVKVFYTAADSILILVSGLIFLGSVWQ